MKGTVIVDGNSICHANHHASKLTVGTMQTQAIFGMLKSMRVIIDTYQGWNIVVLWDGRAQWRYDLYPDYKGNRAPKDAKAAAEKAAYKAQSPFVKKALSLLGITQIMALTHEADDLAGLMSKKLSAAGVKVTLITGDQDWLQLVNDHVTWFDPIRDRQVTIHNFFNETGYTTPLAFLQGKALMGDTSDTITGVGGIGEKGAPEFLAEFGDVIQFFIGVGNKTIKPLKVAHKNLCGESEFTKDEWQTKFQGDPSDKKALDKHMKAWPGQGKTIYFRNFKLMDLQQVPAPEAKDIIVTHPDYDEAKFRLLCEKLAFVSITRNFDNFLTPFRELNKSLVTA